MAAALKLDHVSLLVSSIEASEPYYDALLPLLGFTKERPGIWTDGAGFFFQFREAKPGTGPYERFGAGMNHLGFAAPDPETVERVRSAMEAAGFPIPEIQELGGAIALFMKDPDGIRFEITYYPPGVNVVD
jgi:catechol 2,3-dioxygenase-like lactoylglutathione lyase family enzyme